MSMQEFVPIVVLIAVVMIIAYVARRSQAVGLPPGVSDDRKSYARSAGATQDSADTGAAQSRRVS
jgi:hypothetical protein